MPRVSRFTKKAITLSKNVVGCRGEVAAPEGGDGFVDYAVVSLHCLRIYFDESYRNALDPLSEMPHILAEIGFEEDDLPDHPMLVKRLIVRDGDLASAAAPIGAAARLLRSHYR